MRRLLALSLVFLAVSCAKEATQPAESTAAATTDTAAWEKEIKEWQTKRAERLKKEDSWLTLVGLDWLKEGDNPAPAGTVSLAGGKATFNPAEDATIDGKPVSGSVTLLADADENGPTIVRTGTKQFNVIKRGDRFGLRIKDSQSPTRLNFKGLEYFPIDPKWRVEARLEAYHPPKQVPITDVTGMTSKNISPGALVFELDGKEYRVDPIIEEGSDELFIIFKDETSKDATYPAGRYLYANKPGTDGKVIVDFNKAYNPPCVFTPYATCPLPPPQNRLTVRVEAGEKKYVGAGH
jgi:uncharacterized protein (DUF1684 family)